MTIAPHKPHILLVVARYYADIVDELTRGAKAALDKAGASHDQIIVPGAFEIPAAIALADRAAHRPMGRSYDGYVALGCVIRGETTHYDYVCGESARALMDLTVGGALSIGYGIITVENEAQAWARARQAEKDKGGDAARACLDMIALRRRLLLGVQ